MSFAVPVMFQELGRSEVVPRYIFAERLISKRTVLEIGAVAASGGKSAALLLALGARSVVACDDDPAAIEIARATLATDRLTFGAMNFAHMAGSRFDFVAIADLAPYVRAPDGLRAIAALLAPGGCLIAGLRNPSGLAWCAVHAAEVVVDRGITYGTAALALSQHFAFVRTATQSPALAYQLAFDDVQGLQLDGTLVSDTEAAYYVVFASNESLVSLDPVWVQLPPEPMAFVREKIERAYADAGAWRERAEKYKTMWEAATADALAMRAELEALRESKR